jgi:pimeloyl-ACP methyl ester carboxylesterase
VKLEVIARGSAGDSPRPSLLFIHGGFHGAWCWDEYLLPWFASRGWHANALSLRGHGNSEGHADIRRWTMDDYAADVMQVLAGLRRPTVLVGHSMGGVVAQRCWERSADVAGMVLYASSPLRADPAVVRRLLRLRPFSLLAGQLLGIPSLQLRACEPFLFSDAFDRTKVAEWRARLSPESPRAMAETFSRAPQKRAEGDPRPALVIAGQDDWSIPISAHEALAADFGADLKVCPGAHDLMLDPRWEENASTIETWLQARFPSAGR